MNLSTLPSLNAMLNSASAILLISGYAFIRRRQITRHKICMLSACVTSTLFLACYIYYHLHHGGTHFPGKGWVRPLYFTILISHSFLAIVQVPLIMVTLFRALQSDFARHVKIARVTLPIWVYVSVTGVVVYWMLYRMQY